MSRQFGEEGRRLSYGSYLRLLELLQLQTGLSAEHDELLFIVAHQAYELRFKVVLHELAGARPLRDIYRERERHADLFDLCEALLDHDETFALWRARHVLMVERQIGGKPGTGGSSGAEYLRSTLGKRFFPELWEVRSEL